MIKESCNLTGQDHFGNLGLLCIILMKLSFSKLFSISLPLWWSKDTSRKFLEIQAWKGMAGHNQVKVLDFDNLKYWSLIYNFFGEYFYVKNLRD